MYGYYRRGEDLIAHVQRDAPLLRALARWPARNQARIAAAVAHALPFDTWRSLVRVERLEDAKAAELMVDLVRAAAVSDVRSD